MSARLAVVGGGVVGSIIAWRAARNGWRTTLHAPDITGAGTSVAGGMLGCAGEGRPGEDALLEFALAARDRWPALLADLDASGVDTADIMVAADTLLIAADSSDVGHLRAVVDHLAAFDVRPESVDRDRMRSAAAMLGSSARRGYLVTGEGAVDNRALLAAVRSGARSAGVTLETEKVCRIGDLDADQVVVATGSWAPDLIEGVSVTAEKGEILRLSRPPTAPPPPDAVVRARWRGRSVYVVPRRDGVVVGATQYETGDRDDTAPRVGGVSDLLIDATELMPGLAEYRVAEIGSGLRPTTADGLPLVGRRDRRTVVAVGHGRNGILTAPLTAEIVVDLLDVSSPPSASPWVARLDPRRSA
ncbi:glycine oxidase ThiO [Williamsia sp. Leaf354]|uniref:glycine oxidase ThiO n=1 Tax=Williamsia sp. Leaf354 TaxID=1736349 RepID=UPI001F465CBA|nr:glycine oxidase ThiO [Williamsia sp. Leaf354]